MDFSPAYRADKPMAASDAVENREFDWFARDGQGRFAVLATAGSGCIPDLVQRTVQVHDDINCAIGEPAASPDSQYWGLPGCVWHRYAACGFFVYDWSDMQDSYVRVAAPMGEMPQALHARLSCCAEVMQLPMLDFSRVAVISSGAWK